MKISIKAIQFSLTRSLVEYVETKIGSLANILQALESEGVVEAWVEVSKTTKHHKKGDVFRADCSIKLPGKIIRAEHEDWNVRRAIDEVRKQLREEVSKYKEKTRPQDSRGEKMLRKLRGK